jgi:hypothetical protein
MKMAVRILSVGWLLQIAKNFKPDTTPNQTRLSGHNVNKFQLLYRFKPILNAVQKKFFLDFQQALPIQQSHV